MAVCALSRAFRRLNILRKDIPSAHYTTQQTELPVCATPIFLQIKKPIRKETEDHIKFTPRAVNLDFGIPISRLPLSKIIECPYIPNVEINDPLASNIKKSDIMPNNVIEMPTTANTVEKQAARLIVIRRKKMKKHKRRKHLKKFRFVYRKREQNRAIKREKEFQAELQGIYQTALRFDAKEYVAERLHHLKRERLPNKWQGHYVSESMIREFIKERDAKRAYRERLRTYRLKLE